MKTTGVDQCPNCWGYQEYSEQFSDREMCNCNNENKES